jgi:fructokinase
VTAPATASAEPARYPDPAVVVCGEALIDLVPAGFGQWRAVCGGGPANIAVALARLGTRVAFAGRLATDGFGRQIREHLRAAGVDLRYAVAAAEPTTLAVLAVDAAGRADYRFYVDGTADWPWTPAQLPGRLPDSVRWLCVGTLASVLPPGAEVIRHWAGRHRVPVVFDVNVRPAVLPDPAAYRERVYRWLPVATVVKASEDDLAWLYPDRDPLEAARDWLQRAGPALVLLTRGGAGAVALPRDGAAVTVPAPPVSIVDTVGAGDTFVAGFVHRYPSAPHLNPGGGWAPAADDLAAALRFAVAAAALTCTRPGASPPTAAEVDQLLAAG